MNLQRNRIAYQLIACVIIAIIFFGSCFMIVSKTDIYFNQAQKEATIQNIRTVEGILRREMASLSIVVTDWGMWDSMYNFILDGNQSFVTSELQDQTLRETKTNVLVIKRGEEILFSKQIYNQDAEDVAVPEDVLDAIDLMWQNSGNEDMMMRRTMVSTGSRKLILVSRKVTKSDGTGESLGTVSMGEYIDEGFLNEFDNVPGFYFNVFPYEEGNANVNFKNITKENPLNVEIENTRRVIGAKLLNDASLEHPLILEIEHVPRIRLKYIDIIIVMSIGAGVAYLLTISTMMVLCNKLNESGYVEKGEIYEPIKKKPKKQKKIKK